MVERELLEVWRSVDPVHDLKWCGSFGGVLDPIVEPLQEGLRLGREAEAQECVDREGRIPDPREAVVPVSFPADLFRQAGRRRRHERPGRGVGHELERHRRALHRFAPATLVPRSPEPAAPEVAGLLKLVDQLFRGHHLHRALGRCLEHDAADISSIECGEDVNAVLRSLDVPLAQQPAVAAGGSDVHGHGTAAECGSVGAHLDVR
jgi:hypothetical protein